MTCDAEGEGVIARQLEPALLRQLSASDGEERGDAGLGGQHVVAGLVDLARAHVVADGENLAARIDEEAEFGILRQLF